MPAVVTFDPTNLRIVEISAAGDNELDVLEIYSEWKQWLLDDPSRLAHPQAFRFVGGDPISATQSLGSTYFLINGWRIRPAELSHKLTLVGNLFTDPAGDSVFVPTTGAFNVNTETRVSNLVDTTIANAPTLQHSTFGSEVTVDTTNITGLAASGTAFPAGTPSQPSDNFTDALAIANERGLFRLAIKGGTASTPIQIPTGNYQFFTMRGDSESATFVDVLSAASVTGTIWQDMDLRGTFDGVSHIENCVTRDLSFVEGVVKNCRCRGTIKLTGTNQFSLLNCVDDLSGLGTPAIDWNSADIEVIVRNFRGGLACRNRSNAKGVSIDGVLRLVLESTFAGTGSVIARGLGPEPDVQNPSPAFTLTSQMVSSDLVNLILDEPTASHLTTGTIGDAIAKVYALLGLDAAKPLTVTATRRFVGPTGSPDVDQSIDDTAGVVTVTRQ